MPPCFPFCPRLLVCDLDGTLLTGNGVLTEATAAALRKAIDTGIEVVFATGRRSSFAWKALAPLGLHPETVLISSNGAITRTFAGDTIHRMAMPVATARLLCRQFGPYRDSLIFTFDRTGSGALVVEDIEALHRHIPRWVESNRNEIASVLPLESAFERSEEPVQAMICGTPRAMREAIAFLEDAPPDAADMDATNSHGARLRHSIAVHRTEYAARDLSIVDMMPAGCSKGNAIARLAALRGIPPSEVAAIGDNMNDVDMLGFAGWAVVMKNSPDELLAMASRNGWVVTGSNEEDGAAQAILGMLEKAQRPAGGNILDPALADSPTLVDESVGS